MAVRPHQRRFVIALVVSILAHVALFTLPKVKAPELVLGGAAPQTAMNVRLIDVTPSAPQETAPSPAEPQPAPAPPPRPVPVPAPIPTPRVTRKSPLAVPPEQPPAPPQPPRPPPIPEFDMAAMIEARRQQRRAIQEAQQASGPRIANAPTQEQLTQSHIDRNLRMDRGQGVGGVFEILRKGTRTAEFAFNGWRPDTEKRWREVIEVDAGVGGDLELAIVRRMIELIRTHYTGDFRWDSHYLGRVVVLSARPADQQELEEFLQREFFGQPTVKPAYR